MWLAMTTPTTTPTTTPIIKATLRSRNWFAPKNLDGFMHRAYLKAEGFSDAVFDGRPVIGICNSWSELNNCNAHLRQVAEAVKRGVWSAGGFPLEFPVISLGEILMKPTTMLFRNLMAMDVEECIRAYPLDSVVLLAACDKTTPAMLMGAASADVPAIMVTGGPMLKGMWCNQELGSGTDARKMWAQRRAGEITDEVMAEVEACLSRSSGHCMVMGTASTMAAMAETLGLALPGNAAIPAADSRRLALAEMSGRRAVEIALARGPKPSEILTAAAFDNAIRADMALGGSTNAIVHLVALAGRAGVPLPMRRFDELSRTTPLLANVRPSGKYLMEDFYYAGGVPAVLRELLPMLDGNALSVNGKTLRENVADAPCHDSDIIRPLALPIQPEGGTVILTGNLCPGGAVLKQSAASPHLMVHRGRAVVFEDHLDLERRIDDPSLPIDENSVLVLKHAGPKGGPGMPEWGAAPVPARLLKAGVKDLVRISDARMSGTSYGTVVLHVTPESAVGGPLALVRNGDEIELNVPERRLTLRVPHEEIARRQAAWKPRPDGVTSGYLRMFLDHVLQADEGVDFDFLRGRRPVVDEDTAHGSRLA
jgi:dihydroxy-acid dehydratase